MKNHKISVIIPTRNEEKRLGNLLRSIKKQDYKNYEVIIGDYASTDRTVAIAKRYGAVVINSKVRGVGAGRNAAMKRAHGDIMAFIDADYILPKGLFRKAVDGLYGESNDKVIAVQPMSKPNLSEVPKNRKKSILRLSKAVNRIAALSFRFSPIPIAWGCVFLKRDILDSVGTFNEKVLFAEDIDLYARIRKRYTRKDYAFKILKCQVTMSYRRFINKGIYRTLLFYFKEVVKTLVKKESNTYLELVRD